jgi:hypothetical protein
MPQAAAPRMSDGYNDRYNQTHKLEEIYDSNWPASTTPRKEYEHSRGSEWSPSATQTGPRDLRYSQQSEYDK